MNEYLKSLIRYLDNGICHGVYCDGYYQGEVITEISDQQRYRIEDEIREITAFVESLPFDPTQIDSLNKTMLFKWKFI